MAVLWSAMAVLWGCYRGAMVVLSILDGFWIDVWSIFHRCLDDFLMDFLIDFRMIFDLFLIDV